MAGKKDARRWSAEAAQKGCRELRRLRTSLSFFQMARPFWPAVVGRAFPNRLQLRNERGQTSLEYLLLLSVSFIAGYIVITGPMATFTRLTIFTIRAGIQNTVRNGEWREGEVVGPGEAGHPGDPNRLKPVHF